MLPNERIQQDKYALFTCYQRTITAHSDSLSAISEPSLAQNQTTSPAASSTASSAATLQSESSAQMQTEKQVSF